MDTVTLSDLKVYIEKLASLQAGDQPYTINYHEGVVTTKSNRWNIVIPEVILTDIKLEEA